MSSINFNTIREKCQGCENEIFCHHKVIICQGCNTIYHANCSQNSFSFDHRSQVWTCYDCHTNVCDRYNPFESVSSDKHDHSPDSYSEDVNTISNILKSCNHYDTKKFNYLTQDLKSENRSLLSIVFNNIDGNASNFDHFIADLSQYKERFAVIAIAETNVDEQHKDLYKISGYSSEYNDKAADKRKGSGVCLYVNDKYQFTRAEKFCRRSENLEALFVEITNIEVPQLVGVVL